MKNKFKVGDIVKGKHNNGYGITNENMIEGRVTGVFGEMIDVKPLKFAKDDCTSYMEFRVRSNAFELVKPIKEEAIVIYRKGDKVYALDKQTGEKASAKCHRDDEFDFKKGAKIAFNRLLGKEPVKPQGYKEGDKVKVRSDLNVGDSYYSRDGKTYDSFVYDMKPFAGKIVTIKYVHHDGYKYHIEGCSYNWTDDMFEGKADEFEASLPTLKDDERVVKRDRYKVGDRVKIVDKFTGECLKNKAGHMDKYQGKVLTICEIHSPGRYCMVEDDRKKFYIGDKWVYNEHCIEGKVVKKDAFEIGDKVKVKTAFFSVPKGAIGEVVKCNSINGVFIDFKVEYPDCHTGCGTLPKPTGVRYDKTEVVKV